MTEHDEERNMLAEHVIVTMCGKMLDETEKHINTLSLISLVSKAKADRHRIFLAQQALTVLNYAMTMNPPEDKRDTLVKLKHQLQSNLDTWIAELAVQ